MTFLFVVWGALVGFVLGQIWVGTLSKTRLAGYGWSEADQQGFTTLVSFIAGFAIAIAGGVTYSYYGWMSATILPPLYVLATVVVVELLWSGVPALWNFAVRTIERTVTASVAGVHAFSQSWSETGRRVSNQ